MITKRMVGIALVILGIMIVGGVFAVDIAGAGNWTGLGPAQQLAIGVGLVTTLIGLSLLPLGDQPA